MAEASSRRLNRIPRVIATRPSLCTRLHRWLERRRLRKQCATLGACLAQLEQDIANDERLIAANKLQYLKSPVLQQRRCDDLTELQRLKAALAAGQAKLDAMEYGL